MGANKITQKYIDVETIDNIKQRISAKLVSTADSELKMDLMIALDILKECFAHKYVERSGK